MSTQVADTPTGNIYDKYASRNPIERRLMHGFFRALDSTLPRVAPERILEVGAGEGEIARALAARYPEARITILDLPDPELAGEWRSLDATATHGDATHLPFPDQAFDLVLAIEVLEHVEDPDAALHEIARVARGAVVVSVPREPIWRVANMARGKYWRSLGNTPGHVNHWGTRGFSAFVGRELRVERTVRPFPWTVVGAHRG
ncbi:MAG: class I SAM-dependent methyltransferase [Acidimicrobiia bacterium]|nr:class I SAM-dependent methyltransferase [Acidimicrobiia bacterium]